MNEARWGKAAMRKPMDRTRMQALSMEEFNVLKNAAYIEDQAWLTRKRNEYFAAIRGTARRTTVSDP